MLRELSVSNLALSVANTLEFSPRMNAITGETGAGKSLTVDALALVLGGRGEAALVRHGAPGLEVSARFDLAGHPALEAHLEEQGLGGDEHELLLRRELNAAGHSRAFVNGHACTLRELREIGSDLVVIHGQHEGLRLLESAEQLKLLDVYAGITEKARKLRDLYLEYKQSRDELQRLSEIQKAGAAHYRELVAEIAELEKLELGEGSFEALEQRFDALSHHARLEQAVSLALAALSNDGGNVIEIIEARLHDLEPLRSCDEAALDPVLGGLREALTTLAQTRDRLEVLNLQGDPGEQERLGAKMGRCMELARAHQVEPSRLYTVLDGLRERRDDFLNLRGKLEHLKDAVAAMRARYEEAARALSADRQAAAGRLSREVTALVRTLEMADANFAVEISPATEPKPRPQGRDEVSFTFSANRGEPLRPLSQVASGGELSRLSLCIEVLTVGAENARTMLFDEVDTGISGRTASAVGTLLQRLGERSQIIAVTHLPQVAARAQKQFLIAKDTDHGVVRSVASALDRNGRIGELARMMGGTVVTADTLRSAEQLLDGNE